MDAVETQFRYARPSEVEIDSGRLQLSTAQNENSEYPYFFQGQVSRPEVLGACLKALASVVGNRFFTPPSMLARLIAESDPVITCGNDRLRFEGFSACCGVYGRVDLNPETYSGIVAQPGTTNVDFNPQMLKELARIRGKEQIGLAVGNEEFVLLKDAQAVVEKKVKLPLRWIKGFLAVQASQARMQPRFSLKRVEATRLLRSFPKTGNSKDIFWEKVPASTSSQ